MKKLVVVIATLAITGALGALACGNGGDKPPLTPDTEHGGMMDEAGAGATGTDGGK